MPVSSRGDWYKVFQNYQKPNTSWKQFSLFRTDLYKLDLINYFHSFIWKLKFDHFLLRIYQGKTILYNTTVMKFNLHYKGRITEFEFWWKKNQPLIWLLKFNLHLYLNKNKTLMDINIILFILGHTCKVGQKFWRNLCWGRYTGLATKHKISYFWTRLYCYLKRIVSLIQFFFKIFKI